jgi:hypothetical protein
LTQDEIPSGWKHSISFLQNSPSYCEYNIVGNWVGPLDGDSVGVNDGIIEIDG